MSVEATESLAAARRVDARCDEFEQALAAGKSPVIESVLSGLPPQERRTLLLELLGLEVDFRMARNERPALGDYATRFPELSVEQIAAVLDGSRLGGDTLIGRKLHIYQCVSLVGSGAMGRVYLAMHDDLQRHCALKILSPRRGVCDAEYVARFLQEGQAAAALIHPNIVTLHAVGQMAGRIFWRWNSFPAAHCNN